MAREAERIRLADQRTYQEEQARLAREAQERFLAQQKAYQEEQARLAREAEVKRIQDLKALKAANALKITELQDAINGLEESAGIRDAEAQERLAAAKVELEKQLVQSRRLAEYNQTATEAKLAEVERLAEKYRRETEADLDRATEEREINLLQVLMKLKLLLKMAGGNKCCANRATSRICLLKKFKIACMMIIALLHMLEHSR